MRSRWFDARRDHPTKAAAPSCALPASRSAARPENPPAPPSRRQANPLPIEDGGPAVPARRERQHGVDGRQRNVAQGMTRRRCPRRREEAHRHHGGHDTASGRAARHHVSPQPSGRGNTPHHDYLARGRSAVSTLRWHLSPRGAEPIRIALSARLRHVGAGLCKPVFAQEGVEAAAVTMRCRSIGEIGHLAPHQQPAPIADK